MVKVKVCGITRLSDALLVIELGADFLGFNFWPGTRRFIAPADAKKIIGRIKGKVKIVGVFVNQPLAEVKKIIKITGLDYAQLHGEESPEYCAKISIPVIKAIRLSSGADLEAAGSYKNVLWLIDSRTEGFGGSGVRLDLSLAKKAGKKLKKIILAGGLNSRNVGEAVKRVRPWAVDVASGVESSPGIKNKIKLKRFFEAVKNVSR